MQIVYTALKKSLILFGFLADNEMFELCVCVYIVEGDACGGGCFDGQWLCVYSRLAVRCTSAIREWKKVSDD